MRKILSKSRQKNSGTGHKGFASGKLKVDTYKAGECLLFYIC